MISTSARRMLLALALVVAVNSAADAQAAAPTPSGATVAWTLRLSGDIRWQQVQAGGYQPRDHKKIEMISLGG